MMEQILRDQGWEPESNICRCGHLGGDHSSWGNRCLICEDDIFSSFSEKELWANAIAALEAAGVTRATPDAGGVFWDERAHEIGADPALSDFQKVNVLLRLIDATPAPLPSGIEWEDVVDGLEVALSYPAEMEVNRERWRAARIAILDLWDRTAATPAPLDGHPGEHHDYDMTCCRCGEPGYLFVGFHSPGETFTWSGAQPKEADRE